MWCVVNWQCVFCKHHDHLSNDGIFMPHGVLSMSNGMCLGIGQLWIICILIILFHILTHNLNKSSVCYILGFQKSGFMNRWWLSYTVNWYHRTKIEKNIDRHFCESEINVSTEIRLLASKLFDTDLFQLNSITQKYCKWILKHG